MADMGSGYKDPQIGGPSARQGSTRFTADQLPGEAMVKVGQAMQSWAAKQKELDDRKQQVADSNAAFKILNDNELGIAEDLSNLSREGIDSETYRTRAQELIATRTGKAEELIGALQTDTVRSYAGHQLGNAATRHTVNVYGESDKRFIDEDKAKTAENRQNLVNLAINAPDDASYASYTTQLKDYLVGKGGTTLSHDEAAKQLAHDMKTVAEERLKAQVRRNPDMVEEVLGKAAGQGMPEHQKDHIREYADAVRRKRAEEDNRLESAAEKVWKAQAEGVEIEILQAARAKTITKDQIAEVALRNRGPRGAPMLSAERVAVLQKVLDDKDVQSDPKVIQQLNLAIQNATTNGQYRAIQRQVDAHTLTEKVNNTDYVHLQTRIRTYMKQNEDEAKVTWREAHEQTLKEITALFRIDPSLTGKMFDDRAQAYEQVLRDLNKASIFREGAQDPREWWNENRVRAAGTVRDILEKQIELRREQLPRGVQVIWGQTTVDPRTRAASAAQTLERLKDSMSADDYKRHRDGIRELRDMEIEYSAVSEVKPGAKPSTNARGR